MALAEPGPPLPRPGITALKSCLLMAALYVLVGGLSFGLLRTTGWVDPVWPAAGIAVGMLITAQPGRRAGIAIGSFLLSLPIQLLGGLSLPAGVLVSAGVSLAATVQAQVGAHLVRQRLGPRPPLQRSGEILRFMVLAGPLACLIGASLDVLLRHSAGLLTPAEVPAFWVSWWAGDSIGVIVFAPLTLMALPSQRDLWQGRRRAVALPSLVVLVMFLVAFLHARSIERREALLRINQRADLAVESLRRTLTAHNEALYGLQSLIRATGEPSPDQFSHYTSSHLMRLEGLQALSWNPLVPDHDRNAFEARQRRLPGREGFRITEKDGQGTLVPARRRPTSVPVTLIEPLRPNRAALGYDISSDPIRNAAIRAALATGTPKATSPIKLVQERGVQKGVLLILPIDEPRGFVVGVYRLGDLLENSFRDPVWGGFQLRLLESRAGGEPSELARVPSDADSIASAAGSDLPILRRPIDVGGQEWLLEVQKKPSFQTVFGGGRAAWIPLLGLLVCAPLEGFLLLTSGTERLRQRNLQRKLRTSLTAAAKAHEIKQPLARLLLQARAIQKLESNQHDSHPSDEALSGEALAALAEGIVRDARQVSVAIDGIRNLLTNEERELEPMTLNEPVQTALLLLNVELEQHDIQIEIRGLERPHRIQGDPVELQLMLINLLRNAMAATGSGGRIRIALNDTPFGVELEVEDDGPGFPKEVERIEDLFLTSHRPEGTGIGLFLVNCAVENHRASIHLARCPLGGAGISIRFPPVSSWRGSRQAGRSTS
jgi:signal transduction histidine kinase